MRFSFFLIASAFITITQASPSVLVYHDVADGYGDAILTAIDNLWPACTALGRPKTPVRASGTGM